MLSQVEGLDAGMKRDRLTGYVKLLLAQEKGLTAIELAVVVAILAILAALVAVGVTGMNRSARDA
ncbi:MAG: prepilin-type N-terminal cleavage/methylation domain-containing protein, partial [Dehalococcoidia bacterium]|nr:prepilin-type N-terminal cleavage/methylation domain-containing protein [Dehalococcoidia bacterium]